MSPEEMYAVPIGKGVIRRGRRRCYRRGFSQMVYEAVKAAKSLQTEGIEVEIIDPRTFKPLDEELIVNSVQEDRQTDHCRCGLQDRRGRSGNCLPGGGKYT